MPGERKRFEIEEGEDDGEDFPGAGELAAERDRVGEKGT